MCRRLRTGLVLALCLTAAACREEGAVQVKKLEFTGVKAVEESRLRGALATRQSSRLPWGRKYYFDRGRFDADLKRIEAFYADRGYPDARVTGFDVQLTTRRMLSKFRSASQKPSRSWSPPSTSPASKTCRPIGWMSSSTGSRSRLADRATAR